MNFKSFNILSTNDLDNTVKITSRKAGTKNAKPKSGKGRTYKAQRIVKLTLRTSEF